MNSETTSSRGRWFRFAFDFAVGIVLLLAGGLVILKNLPPPSPKLPDELISLADAAVEGNPMARVAVVEFTDYQCPVCGVFARQTKPAVRASYIETGRVQWAYRNLPIESKHPQAFKAAALAECARRQDRFLPVAKALFDRQKDLGAALFADLPRDLGLDQDRLDACIADDAETQVRADLALAQRLKISGTPTFFVGLLQSNRQMKVTSVLRGSVQLAALERILDDELNPNWYSGWKGMAVGVGFGLVAVATMIRFSRRRRSVRGADRSRGPEGSVPSGNSSISSSSVNE